PKGNYIKITIEDTGSGIKKENIGKIFDPFFTTKPGKSGLGLTVVYSVITAHNGYIFVESTPEKGSQFTIYLPS
ncbi:hybrid sensor histidine kinase/response regulator, partial [bacterium]|nr:hybrid sensor histidine kinase/response regulator [bacterium]